MLHFHFGGSVAASIHSDRKAAGRVAKAGGIRSLVVDFRPAPEHPYPAQLDDAETAYRRLLSQGYEPKNIGCTGHSIGGTLAVMLPLRPRAKGEELPGAIVSVSPWTDLTLTHPAVDGNEKNDRMLSRSSLERFRAAWQQDPAVDFADPAISLARADLTGLPPTTVHYGAYEILADDGITLGRRLAEHGVTSEVHEMPEGQHSFILGAGRVPETNRAIQQTGQWLRHHLGARAARREGAMERRGAGDLRGQATGYRQARQEPAGLAVAGLAARARPQRAAPRSAPPEAIWHPPDRSPRPCPGSAPSIWPAAQQEQQ
ncbi:alpha/beta hydrolase [Streptomyces sp. NPDC050509]|uniref:alpha/beta hydrolase n=1 Tax=Streptomyces sp. NPDC050509 TaxID=3365620 RepID=UPI0037ACE301